MPIQEELPKNLEPGKPGSARNVEAEVERLWEGNGTSCGVLSQPHLKYQETR
jgi:hypothetical protein